MDEYLNNKKKQKVTSESLIRFKGKAFSVEPQYINCYVDVEEQNNTLYIYYKDDLIDTIDLNIYDKNINYKKEHYTRALAQSFGPNVKLEDVEDKALENLKNLDRLGGIVNEIQQIIK